MEVDILNDILSRTVSNLFSDKIKHMSYVSEDDGGDKPELSLEEKNPQKIIKNKPETINNINLNTKNQNKNEPQPKPNLIEKLINNNIQKNNNLKQNNIAENNQNNQPQENLSPKKWCLTIGKKKYEEALKRLQISEKMIASKTLITQMNKEQLVNEKARVKQELKKYDEDFYQVFKSKPAKENKEVMKPLYYYYQKIKLEKEKKSANKENNSETIIRNNEHHNTQTNKQSNNMNYMNNTNTQSVFPSTITYNESTLIQEGNYGNNTTNSNLNTNQIQLENNRTNKFVSNNNTYHISSKNNSINSINTVNSNTSNNNYNVFHRKANSGGGISNNNPKIKKEDFIMNKAIKKRSLSKEEINALEKEYFTIKNEQNNLTQMLRNYQNEFQKTNNRKVRWAKDIKPVEKEYNKYKMNKERIKQIKELFGYMESNNNNK